jgi:tRNA(Ser,Leu) C12 N-acetylase TAN1
LAKATKLRSKLGEIANPKIQAPNKFQISMIKRDEYLAFSAMNFES